jgi:hypothetical protein
MSIVELAPKGWEFQYAATAMIGLTYSNDDDAFLIVEPKEREDAELILETKNGKRIIEIQVKSSQSDLDSSELASFLAHFPDGQATDNLLARLLQDKNRLVLFIVGARCGDSTRGFLTRVGEVELKAKSMVSRTHLEDLFTKFGKAHHSKNASNLESDRDSFCQKLATDLLADQTLAKDVARRILIWEQLEKVALEKKIEDVLWRDHLVPKTQTSNARLASIEAVRLVRAQNSDLIPELKKVLAEFAGMSLAPERYLQRGCEREFLEELKNKRVLLLAGQSKCGKTQTARFLAQECRKIGISYDIGSVVPEAIRYLNFVGHDDRLFLLDDPFGHLILNATAAEDLSRLRNLLADLPPHRFLIVTSRSDIVSAADAQTAFPGFAWHDLTVKDSKFLINFWTSKCIGKGLSASAFETVLQNLSSMNQNDLLQPGQLRHLAFTVEPVAESDFSALCSLARCNSIDLANNFLSRGAAIQQLHAALALGATVIHALPIQSLKYMLSADGSRPGIHLKDPLEFMRLGDEGPLPPFPDEPKVAEISVVHRDELSLLERRGFIRFSRNEITFAHPDYFEASTSVLLRFPPIHFEELLEITIRAVTGLFPPVAKNALRQLLRMYDSYTDAEERRAIVELAFLAFNSIFPSVRDLALTILVSWLDEMKEIDQERVLNLVQRIDLRFDDILSPDGAREPARGYDSPHPPSPRLRRASHQFVPRARRSSPYLYLKRRRWRFL